MIKVWGTPSNSDRVHQVTRFYTTDPLAVLAAQEKLMSDPSMADFPGQVGLSQTAIGNRLGANGATPLTCLPSDSRASKRWRIGGTI